ncbi:MAG: DUF4375 domain-containing protein [Verrucomicrobiales bacterium]|nr:DUF4375 domain-containing protein [Verrucomicrobiales bacterium]
MSERVKCERCVSMILETTAKANEGLCGLCIREKGKEDFDAIVEGWVDDPSTLPGAHGNPEPENFALKLAASQIRGRLYPTEEDKIENFCENFFEAAHTKWSNQGSSSLTAKEKHFLAIETFYGEVLNGGLLQYLANESGSFAQWADESFEAIGIPTYATVIRNVKELFPNGLIPEDSNERWDFVETIDDDKLEAIEEPFWERYHANKNEIRELAFAYLKN